MVISVPLRPLFERILPAAFYDAIKVTIFGWEFRDKYDLHDRVGPAFILVTPATNQLLCADPAMAQVILARRKDFVQSPTASKIMNFLGKNIVTVSSLSFSVPMTCRISRIYGIIASANSGLSYNSCQLESKTYALAGQWRILVKTASHRCAELERAHQ